MTRTHRILAASAAFALAAATLPLAFSAAGAADGDEIFQPVASFRPVGGELRVDPDSYTAVRVDMAALRDALADAPDAGAASSTEIDIPNPAGGMERFAVQETHVMQAGLAKAHPEIRTWAGHSLDHPGSTVALDATPMGF